jgi:hypothetical protein
MGMVNITRCIYYILYTVYLLLSPFVGQKDPSSWAQKTLQVGHIKDPSSWAYKSP